MFAVETPDQANQFCTAIHELVKNGQADSVAAALRHTGKDRKTLLRSHHIYLLKATNAARYREVRTTELIKIKSVDEMDTAAQAIHPRAVLLLHGPSGHKIEVGSTWFIITFHAFSGGNSLARRRQQGHRLSEQQLQGGHRLGPGREGRR